MAIPDGMLAQLKQVWKEAPDRGSGDRSRGDHAHAGLFVIDRQGRLSRLYVTQMLYTAVPGTGAASGAERLRFVAGPSVGATDVSYARIDPTAPSERATVPRAGGGTVKLGPGKSARLFVFFATWDQETSGLGGELDLLNRYQAIATRTGLPHLTAVDEASVEPSSTTLSSFLKRLAHPLSYPVALDQSGKLADGYEVLGLPWFVLVSSTGQLLYYREVSTGGWPSTTIWSVMSRRRSPGSASPRAPRP